MNLINRGVGAVEGGLGAFWETPKKRWEQVGTWEHPVSPTRPPLLWKTWTGIDWVYDTSFES